MNTTSIAVIGGGSWATALVKIASNNVNAVHWWIRNEESVAFIHRYKHNPNYLSDVELNLEIVRPSSSIKEVIATSDIIILAVPAAFLTKALEGLTKEDFKEERRLLKDRIKEKWAKMRGQTSVIIIPYSVFIGMVCIN